MVKLSEVLQEQIAAAAAQANGVLTPWSFPTLPPEETLEFAEESDPAASSAASDGVHKHKLNPPTRLGAPLLAEPGSR
jgi:hypothetical protein